VVNAAPTAGTTVPGTGTINTPDDVSSIYDYLTAKIKVKLPDSHSFGVG
jgi:hypothetical protein